MKMMKMSPNVVREIKKIVLFVIAMACCLGVIMVAMDIHRAVFPPVPTESHVVIEADVQAKVRTKVDEYNAITAKVGTLLMASRGFKDDDPDIERKQKPFEDAMEALEIKLGLIALEIEEMEYMPNLVAKRIVESQQDLRKEREKWKNRIAIRIPAEGELEFSFAQGQRIEIGETTVCFFDLEESGEKVGAGINPTGLLCFDVMCVISEDPISVEGVQFTFIKKEEDGLLFKVKGRVGRRITVVN